METVNEFMQKFFAERSELMRAAEARSVSFRERYFTEKYLAVQNREYDRNYIYGRIVPFVVLKVEIKSNSVTVITAEPLGNKSERRIYHLKTTNIGWQIDRKGWECYRCKGEEVENGETCSTCDGVGWKYYTESEK